MVKFYAYYSFGGYKELYLGNSQDNYIHSWFFSMLPIWEARLKEKEDDVLRAKVEEARNLPHIMDVGRGGDNAIPQEASTLVSYGGYDVMYRTAGMSQVVAVKDIDSKDDTGRPAPFMMLFVALDPKGYDVLDKLAEYLLTDLKPFKEKLSELFVYDLEKNGLRFGVQRMNEILDEIVSLAVKPQVEWHAHMPVHLLISAQNMQVTLQNQKIREQDILFASDLFGHILIDRTSEIKKVDSSNPDVQDDGTKASVVNGCNTGQGHTTEGGLSQVVPVTSDDSFCEKASKCARKAKEHWRKLPDDVRKVIKYCAIGLAAIMLIAALTPRSCKSEVKQSHKTSQVVLQ